MKSTYFLCCILLLVVCLKANTSIEAQTPQKERPVDTTMSKTVSDAQASECAWVYAEWTRSDAPFFAQESQIDALLKEPVEVRQLAYARLQKDAKENPKDAVKIFAWGYASFVLAQQNAANVDPQAQPGKSNDFQLLHYLEQPNLAMEKLEVSSYRFNRTKFFLRVSQRYSDPLPSCIYDLGVRLVQQDRRDYDAMMWTSEFPIKGSKERLERVLYFAKQMIEVRPDDVNSYFNYGDAYFRSYFANHKAEDKKEAVWGYREYLKRASEEPNGRRIAALRVYQVENEGKMPPHKEEFTR